MKTEHEEVLEELDRERTARREADDNLRKSEAEVERLREAIEHAAPALDGIDGSGSWEGAVKISRKVAADLRRALADEGPMSSEGKRPRRWRYSKLSEVQIIERLEERLGRRNKEKQELASEVERLRAKWTAGCDEALRRAEKAEVERLEREVEERKAENYYKAKRNHRLQAEAERLTEERDKAVAAAQSDAAEVERLLEEIERVRTGEHHPEHLYRLAAALYPEESPYTQPEDPAEGEYRAGIADEEQNG
jgi:hypothetical protein